MTILYILLAILLLGILVTVHEWGHFISARIVGIDVMEFSIGFGPKLWGHKGKKGTDFSIRAIPLGGYCAFYGEDDAEGKTRDDPRAYSRQSVWKRMFSVIMGPMMNFVLAFIVAVGFYWIGGVEHVTGYEPYIMSVNAAGPAVDAGIQEGDIIESIDGVNMLDGTTDTLVNTLSSFSEDHAPFDMVIDRNGEKIEMSISPQWNAEDQAWRIGVTISAHALTEHRSCTLIDAVGYSWDWCVYAGGAILESFRDLFTTPNGYEQLSGPVGVVSAVSTQVEEYGLEGFLNLLILISINLGLFNLFPIPGLDGSRLIFMIIEAIRRKPVPPEKEAIVHLAGYVLLLGLMVFCTFQDIMRMF